MTYPRKLTPDELPDILKSGLDAVGPDSHHSELTREAAETYEEYKAAHAAFLRSRTRLLHTKCTHPRRYRYAFVDRAPENEWGERPLRYYAACELCGSHWHLFINHKGKVAPQLQEQRVFDVWQAPITPAPRTS